MIVAVGSTNPTKIQPVEKIFSIHFKDVTVKGVSVSSGVKDQPMTDDETYQGALNRAKAALSKIPNASFGVGIEGGLSQESYGWVEKTTVVIVNNQGEVGIGFTGGLVMPESVIRKIQSGMELKEVMDEEFGTIDVNQGVGMFGLMTENVVTRASGTEHGVAFALARFIHVRLYKK